MTKILIDIGQETLNKASALLGATAPEDTVNFAFRYVVDSAYWPSHPPRGGQDVSPDTPHDDDPREGREP